MRFKQELNGRQLDVEGLPEGYYSAEVTVEWSLDIDARNYGIKEMTTTIHSVELEIEDLDKCQNVDIDLTDFTIDNELEINKYGELSVWMVVVDLNDKIITVQS